MDGGNDVVRDVWMEWWKDGRIDWYMEGGSVGMDGVMEMMMMNV